MKRALNQPCLGRYDLAAYVSGGVYAANKRRIEHHLSACHACFEIFIDAFNQCLGHDRASEVRLGQNDVSNSRNLIAQACRTAGQGRASPHENTINEVWRFSEKCD